MLYCLADLELEVLRLPTLPLPPEFWITAWTTIRTQFPVTILLYPLPSSTLRGYLLRDGKADDNLILQDIPADHCRVGLEVPDGDVHGG